MINDIIIYIIIIFLVIYIIFLRNKISLYIKKNKEKFTDIQLNLMTISPTLFILKDENKSLQEYIDRHERDIICLTQRINVIERKLNYD